MNEKLLKPYNPQETEDRIYKTWEESGFFKPENLPGERKEPYTIVMPPPNVTGVLHMGHALGTTLQDLLIRFERMRGKRALWIPGTDHAAIATQSKVEKDIQKQESKSRHDLGREELLKRIDIFARESHDTIITQLKKLGASCDWSREAFTLDEARSLAVRTIFKKMYEDGLIYRGHRIVNWDPKGQTTISDDEIVYEERKAMMYTFKYSKDFPIAISTTRPETKVGDTAVAVHPEDERYKQYVGKEYDLEFAGVKLHIKIIADKEVDKDFGTGALGVTPAHSMIDWAIAERHNLPKPQVINEFAKMMVGDERILNKKTTEARVAIVEWLKSENLLTEEKEITQNVSTAERTGGIVEPLPKLQWFIAVNKEFRGTTLKEIMKKAVEGGQINFVPEHFTKTYFHWINNLNDWRQIWYGHRIPVWYRGNEVYCDINPPENGPHSAEASRGAWEQDPDTLDTWFSSGLWTFSTLGWPHSAEASRGTPNDLETYHPTNTLITAYEIIFFWVARMIMMTGYALEQIPFHNVYFTGIVRDAQGRKFSKSLGNGIDPMVIAEKYGADAGRMAIVMSGSAGTDSKLSEDKIKGYKHFANKIWNVTRYILENTKDLETPDMSRLTESHKKLVEDMQAIVKDVTKDIEEFRFYMAGEKLYQYFWYTFADVIIEESKGMLKNGSVEEKISIQNTLRIILETMIKALHPFIPFVTEEIWSMLPHSAEASRGKPKQLLMVESWPQ
ncbi:valine--tRNA ligase [Candidatus Parcubacteria bacterium]|nr:valine--tRNA ligase [Candidatus Parcubacteria bacterium]